MRVDAHTLLPLLGGVGQREHAHRQRPRCVAPSKKGVDQGDACGFANYRDIKATAGRERASVEGDFSANPTISGATADWGRRSPAARRRMAAAQRKRWAAARKAKAAEARQSGHWRAGSPFVSRLAPEAA
jgi:hypothetical protein